MTRPRAHDDRATHVLGGGAAQRASVPQFERHVRAPWSLPVFASVVSLAFVLAAITDQSPAMALESATIAPAQQSQQLVATDDYVSSIERGEWKTSQVVTYGTAPAAGTPDPGTAMAIALTMVTARGWGTAEYDCLVALWNKESRWNVYAHNASSGAYGIPQALPGTKMATAGADWATNPATQITWGLGYIEARYATPCGAWAHSQRVGWY
jgi:Transglycosylase SLT domain